MYFLVVSLPWETKDAKTRFFSFAQVSGALLIVGDLLPHRKQGKVSRSRCDRGKEGGNDVQVHLNNLSKSFLSPTTCDKSASWPSEVTRRIKISTPCSRRSHAVSCARSASPPPGRPNRLLTRRILDLPGDSQPSYLDWQFFSSCTPKWRGTKPAYSRCDL